MIKKLKGEKGRRKEGKKGVRMAKGRSEGEGGQWKGRKRENREEFGERIAGKEGRKGSAERRTDGRKWDFGREVKMGKEEGRRGEVKEKIEGQHRKKK